MKHFIFGMLFVVLSGIGYAQEVNMNQPSADIVDKGKVFVRSDEFYTQSPANFDENLNLAFGLGHNFELSLNGANAFGRASMPSFLVPGFKWAPIKTKNFEIFVGDQFWKPVTNIGSFHNGNVTYEAAAYKVGNFRFTGGTFQSINAYAQGNRAGALGGVEWMAKMFKNGWAISPGVDYASGAGSNGYTSPGVMFSKGNFFVAPGYMIANPHNPNGAHQSFVMTGYTF
jgi:hypothetical protein